VLVCDGCRILSHSGHAYGYVADLASAERSRLQEVSKRCANLGEQLQRRLDQLQQASNNCAQSVEIAIQSLKLDMEKLQAAVGKRQQQLIEEALTIQQV